MSLEVSPKMVFKYFNESTSSEKVYKLHSVCIACYIYYAGKIVQRHNEKKIYECKNCLFIRFLLSTLQLRRHFEILNYIDRSKKRVSKEKYVMYTDKNIVQILHIPESLSVDSA